MILKDKVAVITGGTSGLGNSVTQSFLEAQAKVVVTYTKAEALQTLESNFATKKAHFYAIKTNVLEEASVKSMVEQVLDKYGRIDILVNLVGGFLGGVSITETSETHWDNMMNLNLKSAFLCCKHVLPTMIKQKSGKIINIGSKGGLHGAAGIAAYSASKAGLINFTQALADEGQEYNITANVVIPSTIDTPANRNAMPQANFNNWVKPVTLSKVILFLCSEEANDISGAAIPVFGKS
jgi:NAD(P)-dependent dehydrogenase (short-subunit alcohol dehydrogenase family)